MNQNQAESRIKQNKDWRQRLDAILQEMKTATLMGKQLAPGEPLPEGYSGGSRHRSLSITHTEDAIMRLGMDMKEVNEANPGSAPNPYPESYNPENAKVEPTADNLKL